MCWRGMIVMNRSWNDSRASRFSTCPGAKPGTVVSWRRCCPEWTSSRRSTWLTIRTCYPWMTPKRSLVRALMMLQLVQVSVHKPSLINGRGTGLTNLKSLNMSYTLIDDDRLAEIVKLTGLKSLNLRRCRSMGSTLAWSLLFTINELLQNWRATLQDWGWWSLRISIYRAPLWSLLLLSSRGWLRCVRWISPQPWLTRSTLYAVRLLHQDKQSYALYPTPSPQGWANSRSLTYTTLRSNCSSQSKVILRLCAAWNCEMNKSTSRPYKLTAPGPGGDQLQF